MAQQSKLEIRNSRFNILSLLFVLLVLAGSCKPKEDVVLRNIRDIVLDANADPTLHANAILYNPNNIRMKLRKISIDVFVNGKKSGVIDQELKLLIPAKAEFTLPIEVKLNIKELGLLDTLFGMLGGKKLKVQFKGSINLIYKGVPIRVPVDQQKEVGFKL